jgi:tetratricopeptide (TPR) repeat protein
MNTKGYLIFILSLLGFASFVQAQNVKLLEKEARELFKYHDYAEAQKLYKELSELDPANPEYMTRYAITCLNSDNKRDALPFLLRAKDLNYTKDDINYYLGRSFHLIHDFDKAIYYFELFKKELNMIRDASRIALVNRDIQSCIYGIELVKSPVSVTIENLGYEVNSQYPEFVPLVSGDEKRMFFTSRRPNTTGGQIESATNQYFEDIYTSEKGEDGEWSEPVSFQHNTKGHDACISLSPNGEKLYIYRQENMGDIYVSRLRGSSWSVPQKLEGDINSKYSETSLSVSPDEKVLFFCSDRPGGFGGLDIYYCVKESDNTWSKPVNAGPNINTPYNEDAPFVHADGTTLYFSSTGHNSMGGYDIFTTEFDIGKNSFTPPVNIGYPINTADDDIFFVWTPDGSRAYFSSMRNDGFGEKDLYVLTRKVPSVSMVVLKGTVSALGSKDDKKLGASIKLIDSETNEEVQVTESNSSTGKFLALLHPGKNYRVVVEHPGYAPHFENFVIDDKDEFYELEKNFELSILDLGVIANIEHFYFEAKVRGDYMDNMDRVVAFLKDNPDKYFELAGHTDSIGTSEDNYKLSERRAKEVYKYLVANGVSPDQLFPVGYGIDWYIADNITDEGRQRNRRTEVIIINQPKKGKYTRKNGFYSKM